MLDSEDLGSGMGSTCWGAYSTSTLALPLLIRLETRLIGLWWLILVTWEIWAFFRAVPEPCPEVIFAGPQQPEELLKYIDRDEVGSCYFCTLCNGFSHKSRANVRNHVESKHFPKHFVYTCQTCGHNCPSHQSLLKHKSVFHKNLPCFWFS